MPACLIPWRTDMVTSQSTRDARQGLGLRLGHMDINKHAE